MKIKKPHLLLIHITQPRIESGKQPRHVKAAQPSHLNTAEGLQPQPLNGGDELRREMSSGIGTGMEPRFGNAAWRRTGPRTRSFTG